ncbi:MAG: 3-methyl-2-oxobutanoate hydroxymethyltransferase [Gaiellales bacterium]
MTARIGLPEVARAKAEGRPLVMVTAYDFASGRIVERAGVDLVLVGDSAAMVVLGHESTVPVTLDELLMLTAAVSRACRRPLVIADLPFMSYQVSDEDALRSAGRFLKEALADAVKLEGAGPSIQRIRALAGAGIPVVGHLGLTPQTATSQGGYRAQARTAESALRLLHDAHAIEAAGAFALVLEAVPAPVAQRITAELTIPTIGIGAGPDCDGQVLVFHDLLGLGEGDVPRFVEQYAELGRQAIEAVSAFAGDVRARQFPAERHSYSIPADELAELDRLLGREAHSRS